MTLTAIKAGSVFTATTPTPNNNGTYTARFMFTLADTYTLQVKLGGQSLVGTPVTGIEVAVGPA